MSWSFAAATDVHMLSRPPQEYSCPLSVNANATEPASVTATMCFPHKDMVLSETTKCGNSEGETGMSRPNMGQSSTTTFADSTLPPSLAESGSSVSGRSYARPRGRRRTDVASDTPDRAELALPSLSSPVEPPLSPLRTEPRAELRADVISDDAWEDRTDCVSRLDATDAPERVDAAEER